MRVKTKRVVDICPIDGGRWGKAQSTSTTVPVVEQASAPVRGRRDPARMFRAVPDPVSSNDLPTANGVNPNVCCRQRWQETRLQRLRLRLRRPGGPVNGRVFINEPRRLGYTFGGLPAVGVIQPGRLAVIEMQDCFGGLVTGPSTSPAAVCDLSRGSPVSGPFYVEGAEPGDTVAVHVVSLSPARSWAVSAVISGAAGDVVPPWHPAPRERVWRHDLDLTAGSARFNSTDGSHAISLPLRPVIGTVGVAPKGGEVISTLTPGPHGGNLGSTCITAGVTVFLPANLPGGLFAIGDGYAMPGDGTASRMAVQCAMTVTLMVGLIKETQAPLIRLESDDSLHSVGYGRPLENALWGAQADLATWMQQLTGMDALDCAQLLALAGSTSIGNLHAAAFTAVATYPKALLPSEETSDFGSMHKRLRHQSLPPKKRDVPMPAET